MIRAHPINRDTKLWGEHPERFDGFRFSRLRDMPDNGLRYQHTSTGTDDINFGHGIWACPGRFFASAQLKVILAELLRRYDVTCSSKTPIQDSCIMDSQLSLIQKLRYCSGSEVGRNVRQNITGRPLAP